MSVQRLIVPIYLLVVIFILGTSGYYALGAYGAYAGYIPESWSLLNCAFMAAISLTTVGYGDYVDLNAFPAVKIYTIVLLFAGMGVVLYVVSEATSFLVEGHLKKIIERRKLLKAIKNQNAHIILCGVDDTGVATLKEMQAVEASFVAIELNPELCDKLSEQFPDALIVCGDAMEEEVLRQAGADRARGLIACLADDRDNVVLTISARCVNPSIKIVARAKNMSSAQKLRAAGADHIVTPNITGGLRLASEMLRPHVTTFLDTMLRASGNCRFGEVELKTGSSLLGMRISDARVREKTGLQVIAVRDTRGDYQYNDDLNRRLEAGDVLIAIGTADQLRSLGSFCEEPA